MPYTCSGTALGVGQVAPRQPVVPHLPEPRLPIRGHAVAEILAVDADFELHLKSYGSHYRHKSQMERGSPHPRGYLPWPLANRCAASAWTMATQVPLLPAEVLPTAHGTAISRRIEMTIACFGCPAP
jgi:hypothetical protein